MTDPRDRPWRSALYIPGSKPRALDKAAGLAADALIFDLEDAIAPAEKDAARAELARRLRPDAEFGGRGRILRVNAFETEWGRADVTAAGDMALDALLLPKVDGPQDIEAVAAALPDLPVWAMIETPRGVLNAAAIAAHPRCTGFVLGTNDLAKEIGCIPGPHRGPLQMALQLALLAARAEGLICLDGVWNAFRDTEGLEAECAQGRALGFDGKTLIHPAQIEAANRAFAPTAAELDLACRQIAAHAEAEAAGQGVAVLDGAIVENLHVVTARQRLAKAEAIAALHRS